MSKPKDWGFVSPDPFPHENGVWEWGLRMESGNEVWEWSLRMGSENGLWEWSLRMEVWEWSLRMEVWNGVWEWGLRMEVWEWSLRMEFKNGVWEWRSENGVWEWSLRMGLENSTIQGAWHAEVLKATWSILGGSEVIAKIARFQKTLKPAFQLRVTGVMFLVLWQVPGYS